jgi:hypothetical protein
MHVYGRLVDELVRELVGEGHVDAGEVVGRHVGEGGRVVGDAPFGPLPRRAGDEARALGALGIGRFLAVNVGYACARVGAHMAVLAGRGGAARALLGLRPDRPLRVRVAEPLEVLALRDAERIGAEEANVMAAPAELARAEVRLHCLGRAEMNDGGEPIRIDVAA